MAEDRTRTGRLRLYVIAALLLFASPAEAAEFSADIVMTNVNSRPVRLMGKLYVSDEKVRLETPEAANGFFVLDSGRGTAFFVRPLKNVFMDAMQSSSLTQILVPVDPDDPCKIWQTMAVNAGISENEGQWRCDPIGGDSIDGRKTIIYSALSARQKQSVEWIDPQLKFLIKSRAGDGTVIELKNIQEGPQALDLFEIPANFSKFDPRQLIESLKHSDVLVEPVK